jgi:hypothetical protein
MSTRLCACLRCLESSTLCVSRFGYCFLATAEKKNHRSPPRKRTRYDSSANPAPAATCKRRIPKLIFNRHLSPFLRVFTRFVIAWWNSDRSPVRIWQKSDTVTQVTLGTEDTQCLALQRTAFNKIGLGRVVAFEAISLLVTPRVV